MLKFTGVGQSMLNAVFSPPQNLIWQWFFIVNLSQTQIWNKKFQRNKHPTLVNVTSTKRDLKKKSEVAKIQKHNERMADR